MPRVGASSHGQLRPLSPAAAATTKIRWSQSIGGCDHLYFGPSRNSRCNWWTSPMVETIFILILGLPETPTAPGLVFRVCLLLRADNSPSLHDAKCKRDGLCRILQPKKLSSVPCHWEAKCSVRRSENPLGDGMRLASRLTTCRSAGGKRSLSATWPCVRMWVRNSGRVTAKEDGECGNFC